MAELRYVDWDGLVYYDGKIKDFIQANAENYLKMGGILPIKDLPDPSRQNLNYIYKITDSFTSDNHFEKPGYVYPAGTWVQCINHEEDERWLYTIFNEETIGGTADLSNYYTKSEVDDKIEDAIRSIDVPEVDLDNYYTKDEVDKLIPETDAFVTESKLEETLSEYVVESELDQYKQDVIEVESALEEKADKTELQGLASEEFVLKKIAEAELADKEADLEAYYTKSETDAKIKEAVDAVDIPDVSNLATKEELEAVQNIAGSNSVKLFAIESDLVDISSQLENIPTTYATKDEVAAVEAKVDAIVIPEVPTKVSELDNDAGYITAKDIPQPELFVVDYNAPDFAAAIEAYNNGKLLLLTNAAPDANGYAVMNYVREDLITFTKFLMSRSETYGSFNTYYLHNDNTWELAKEVKLNKVDAIVDENSDITGLTIGKNTYEFDNFATTDTVNQINETIQSIENTYVTNENLEQKNYVTEQYVVNNYITQEAAKEIYVTNEKVTEVVTQEVETVVTEQIETKVETVIQEKVDAGEIEVNADAINYDTWD